MYKVITEVVGEVIGVLSINTQENTAILQYVSTHGAHEIEAHFYKEEINKLADKAQFHCDKRGIELTYY